MDTQSRKVHDAHIGEDLAESTHSAYLSSHGTTLLVADESALDLKHNVF